MMMTTRIWPALLAATMLSACGGNDGDTPANADAPDDKRMVTGVASKAPLQGATVDFFAMDDAGDPTGSPVASVDTDASGGFTAALPVDSIALLAVTSGGSFVDESDTDSSDGRRSISVPAGQGLRTVLLPGASVLPITPYTHALYRRAQLDAGGSGFLAFYTAVAAQAASIFGVDVTSVLPANPLAPTGSAAARSYALLLGGAAQAMNAIAVQVGILPDFAVLSAFLKDLSDGALDGQTDGVGLTINEQAMPSNVDLNAEIERFRNNNDAAFPTATTTIPTFNSASFTAQINVAPVAADDAYDGTQDTVLTVLAADGVLDNDSDLNGDALTAAVATAPAAAQGTLSLALDGGFTFTPAAGFTGDVTFTYVASDGALQSDLATVTISVSPANSAPSAVDDAYATDEDVPLVVAAATGVLANDSDPDGDPVTATVSGNASNGSVTLDPDGGFSYSPQANFFGTDQFTYEVSDNAGNSATATVTITVNSINDVPSATDDSVTTNEDVAVSINVVANDVDPDGDTLSAALDTPPPNGMAVADGLGGFDYTPNADFNGTDSFTYTVDDGNGGVSAAATVSITVQSVNDAPQGTANTVFTDQDVSYAFSATDFGFSDPSDSPANTLLAVELPSAPADGTIKLNNSAIATYPATIAVADINAGQLTFEPAPAEFGQPYTTFPFQVQDDGGTANGGVDSDQTPRTITVDVLESSSPWETSLHGGNLDIETATTELRLTWPDLGAVYDVCATTDPLLLPSSFSAGTCQHYATGLTTPPMPHLVENLTPGTPYFVAIVDQAAPSVAESWSAATPNVFGLGPGAVAVQALGSDGTRYVGGLFTEAGVVTGSAVTVAPSGDGHPLVFPEVDDDVLASIPDGIGGWYIGGRFNTVGGLARQRLAHIDSLGQVTSWDPGANGTVRALAFDGTRIYAGGDFTIAGGGARARLAAFDAAGALDTGWTPPALDNSVYTIAVDNGVVYAGGQFSAPSPNTGASIAAFDATTGALSTSFDPGADGDINSLVTDGTLVYVGGDFANVGTGSTASTTARDKLAAFTTTGGVDANWVPTGGFAGGLSFVNSLVLDTANNAVFAGGAVNLTDGVIEKYDSGDGSTFAWAPSVNNAVRTLLLANGALYVGGDFTTATGAGGVGGSDQDRRRLAAFDPGDGSLLPWNPAAGGSAVNSLAASNGIVYVGGGSVLAFGAQQRSNLAAFDVKGNLTTWDPGTDGGVYALVESAGVIYAGGDFVKAGSGTTGGGATTRNYLAAFDTSGALTTWDPGADNLVEAMTVSGGDVYVGGFFTMAGGGGTGSTARASIAAFDPAGNLTTWNPGTDGSVFNLLAHNNVIYAGGAFANAGGSLRNNLAAFDTDASGTLTPWNPATNGFVQSLIVSNEVIYAGGNFTMAGGGTADTARSYLAAFASDGTLLGWDPGVDARVQTLATDASTIYVGGTFTMAGGGGTGNTPREFLAAFDADATGSLNPWEPGVDNQVNSLLHSANTIYAGGTFEFAGSGATGGGNKTRWSLATFDTAGALASGPDLLSDPDGDGLTTGDEYSLGTDPDIPDTDGDGLSDGEEVNVTSTDPANPDTDEDGAGDGVEVAAGSDPNIFNNTVIFVSQAATGLNDGTSWADAFTTIGAAVTDAAAGSGSAADAVLILVDGGTYADDSISMADSPRTNISIIGSITPSTYQPSAQTATLLQTSCISGCSPLIEISNATGIHLIGLHVARFGMGDVPVGGGLLVSDGAGTADVTLQDSFVFQNSATQAGGGAAVIGTNATLAIVDSVIEDNWVNGTGVDLGGGAFVIGGGGLAALNGGVLEVFGGSVHANRSEQLDTGGDDSSFGAGIYVDSSGSLLIDDTLVADNVATVNDGDRAFGGGIFARQPDSLQIRNSAFLSNDASIGGGLYTESHPSGAALFNNLFVGNIARQTSGGGAHIQRQAASSTMTVENNTFAFNQGPVANGLAGGGLLVNGDFFDVGHNLLFGNQSGDPATAEEGDNLTANDPTVLKASNLADDPTPDGGGFGGDPLFTQGFFLDQGLSPAVDYSGTDAESASINFPAPTSRTTDPGGAPDSGNLDIGFHHPKSSDGILDDVVTLNSDLCSDFPDFIEFKPLFQFAGAGAAGHLVLVLPVSGVETTSPAPFSRTTLDPRGDGSLLARDHGNGRYSINAQGDSLSSTAEFDVYVDDDPVPVRVTIPVIACT